MFSTIQDLLHLKGSHDVFAIAPGETIANAVHSMNAHNVGSLVVMEQNPLMGIFTGRLVGIITERDILTRVVGLDRVAVETHVEEVMTRKLITVHPDTPTSEAMKIMTAQRCRHLPVLGANDAVIGLISIGDIMRDAIRCLENEVESLSSYIRTGAAYPMYG